MELEIIERVDNCFVRYPGQSYPQDAYLALDLEDGHLYAGTNYEIGNAVPESVWQNRVLRWNIPANLSVDAINRLMHDLADDMRAILADSSIRWDGSNHVGRLTDAARRIEESIAFDLADGRFWDWRDDMLPIVDPEWYFTGSDIGEMARGCIRDGKTAREYIEELSDMAPDGAILDGEEDAIEELDRAMQKIRDESED